MKFTSKPNGITVAAHVCMLGSLCTPRFAGNVVQLQCHSYTMSTEEVGMDTLAGIE